MLARIYHDLIQNTNQYKGSVIIEIMKLLTTIHDSADLDIAEATQNITPRVAARAVVLDGKSIALLKVGRDGYHKLPGGGHEEPEELLDTLRREVLEEIGCEIDHIQSIGQINDYRKEWDFYQKSFSYLAYATKRNLETNMTKKEIEAEFSIVWAPSIEEAITTLEQDKPKTYEGEFIQRRDLVILKEAEKILKQYP